jgi:non-homologous end joining protein Ku
MTTEWGPGNYRGTYRDRVNELIEANRCGDEVVTQVHRRPRRTWST